MPQNRPEILDEISATVMFHANETCCICRISGHSVQIHHIDKDRTNNNYDNLAVICLNCHSKIHSNFHFGRNYAPEEVKLHNENWQGIIKARNDPNRGVSERDEYADEYTREALLEISLTCHGWKVDYMSLYPGQFRGAEGNFRDIWEHMSKSLTHTDSDEKWRKYQVLFGEGMDTLINRLERLVMTHSQAIPTLIKILVLRTIRGLDTQRRVYLLAPQLRELLQGEGGIIESAIRTVVDTLAELARKADSLGKSMTEST